MTATALRHWSDIQAGETFNTESITISRRDILEFAADFDPQPYHLDPDAADNSIFGGLCASGWHVTAVMMRLLTDTFSENQIDLLGSNGVSKLRWRKPVFAEDALHSTITVKEKARSDADAAFGYIDCDVDVSNQHGDSVIVLTTSLMIGSGDNSNG
jgi:acyl dehydratase